MRRDRQRSYRRGVAYQMHHIHARMVILSVRPRATLQKIYKLYWQDFRLDQRIMLVVVAACIALVSGVFVHGTLPFEPLTIYGYETKPERACPGVQVTTFVDSKVEEPLLGSVGTATISTKWRARDGRLTPTVDEPIDLAPHPRVKEESPLKRTAPRDPGRWQVETTIRVPGKLLGLGRTDVIRTQSSPLMTVLPADDPACLRRDNTA